jgi:hypothetical protein
MDLRPRNDVDVQREFAKRRMRQLLLAIPLFIAIVSSRFVVRPPMGLIVLFFAAAVVFSLFNWRCPACSSYLGKRFNPRFCPSCGAQLHS